MTRMLCNFALLGVAVAATPHYSQPPCLSDEVEIEVKDYRTNYTGKVCAPACGDKDSCPSDKPPSAATPKCLLHDSGKKYCGLSCFAGCGNDNMMCLRVDRVSRVCTYKNPKPTPKPCCQGHCADSSKAKYYSIAKSLFGKAHCGECCMDPKKYNLFHFFEKNLTKADNDSPCKVFGYTEYDSTDTHGFGPVSMTLDLYNLPKLSAALPPMICKLVENQMLEKTAIDELCSKQHKVSATECEAALTKLWDVVAQKECPKDELTAIPALVCKLVKLPELEKKAVDGICTKQHKVPTASCEEVLTKAWDAFAKRECPDDVEATESAIVV